jgi:hypothetical protein
VVKTAIEARQIEPTTAAGVPIEKAQLPVEPRTRREEAEAPRRRTRPRRFFKLCCLIIFPEAVRRQSRRPRDG